MWRSYTFSGRDEHEISVFEPVPSGQTLYLTKKPPDTLRIHKIFQADEQLNVICMLRDPRAVISSTHKLKPDVYFAGYQRWQEYLRAIEPLLEHPRFLMIRYEDLLTDPDAQQRRINAKFQFLSQTRVFSSYPEGAEVPALANTSLNGARPFDTTRIDGWKDHLPRVNGQLRDHPSMPSDLIKAGYEQDTDWTQMLDGVDFYAQDYKDKRPNLPRRLEANLRFWWKTHRYLKALRG